MLVNLISRVSVKLRLLFIVIPILFNSDQLWAQDTKLLVLGDSLSAAYGISQTEGWVSLLQDMWKARDIEVVNGAISGETTDGALARLPRLLSQHQPSHVYIELGGNDGLQGHDVTHMQQNLREMIKLVKNTGAVAILQEMQIPTNYGRRYTKMFNQSYAQLAEELNVPLIPFFLQTIALNPDLMQNDGIHPNAQAQSIIAADMQKQLGSLIFTSSPSN